MITTSNVSILAYSTLSIPDLIRVPIHGTDGYCTTDCTMFMSDLYCILDDTKRHCTVPFFYNWYRAASLLRRLLFHTKELYQYSAVPYRWYGIQHCNTTRGQYQNDVQNGTVWNQVTMSLLSDEPHVVQYCDIVFKVRENIKDWSQTSLIGCYLWCFNVRSVKVFCSAVTFHEYETDILVANSNLTVRCQLGASNHLYQCWQKSWRHVVSLNPMILWHGIVCHRKLCCAMKLEHSRETLWLVFSLNLWISLLLQFDLTNHCKASQNVIRTVCVAIWTL